MNGCLQPQSTPEPQLCKLLWDPGLQGRRQGGSRATTPQMLASHPLEESPCAWPLGDTGGAEGGVKSLPWAWAPKMRIQAINLHGNRSPAVTKQPGSSLAGSGSPERLFRGEWNGPGWSPVETLWEWHSAMDTSLVVLHKWSHPSGASKSHASHTRDKACVHTETCAVVNIHTQSFLTL